MNLLLDSLRFLVVRIRPGTVLSFCCSQETAASGHSGGKVRTTSQSWTLREWQPTSHYLELTLLGIVWSQNFLAVIRCPDCGIRRRNIFEAEIRNRMSKVVSTKLGRLLLVIKPFCVRGSKGVRCEVYRKLERRETCLKGSAGLLYRCGQLRRKVNQCKILSDTLHGEVRSHGLSQTDTDTVKTVGCLYGLNGTTDTDTAEATDLTRSQSRVS